MEAETKNIIGPDEGEKLPRGPRYPRVLVELPELEVIDERFGPGFSVPPHTHDDHVDSFYVLEGEGEFVVGGEGVRVGAGTWVADAQEAVVPVWACEPDRVARRLWTPPKPGQIRVSAKPGLAH